VARGSEGWGERVDISWAGGLPWVPPSSLLSEICPSVFAKAVQIMRGSAIRLDIAPQSASSASMPPCPPFAERGVDHLARRHFEPGMGDLSGACERPQHLVIGTASPGCSISLPPTECVWWPPP